MSNGGPLDRRIVDQHKEWLGFAAPVGLVFSPLVLATKGIVLSTRTKDRREEFREFLDGADVFLAPGGGKTARQAVESLFRGFLGWRGQDLVSPPPELDVHLPELGATLSASWAVRPGKGDEKRSWLALVHHIEGKGADLDRPLQDAEDGWHASHHVRFERLLRETGIPIGFLVTDEKLRLLYAPRGETAGWLDFVYAHMAKPAGAPLLAAFEKLLSRERVFQGPLHERLAALLEESRRAQVGVSKALAEQVQEALHILLQGFVEAARRTDPENGPERLLRAGPDHLYEGLVTSLMRIVFVLYAEERELMPNSPLYPENYGIAGLHARLREEADLYGDTMDQRYGAWAQLLSLFRLVHAGGGHGALRFVARKGRFFDPERFPFLEGRAAPFGKRIPRVSDDTVFRMLDKLLFLDGERVAYRTLDVEQIGSVYQAVMGLRVEVVEGASIALKPAKAGAAPIFLDLDALAARNATARRRWFKETADRSLPPAATRAESREALLEALGRLVLRDVTPRPLPPGTPVLQPTDERRRTGSHYTDRTLTEPIVREALRPIFERFEGTPRPEHILDLKILDPAMGSGAFLVEACRQLAEKLVEAWSVHGGRPKIPADEDELLHAKRLIATRCLYGVDRNPMALELGKLSLWLETLAREHEFTFLDHNFKSGDSLVGLMRDQLDALHWNPAGRQMDFITEIVAHRLRKVEEERECLHELAEECGEEDLRELVRRADRQLADLRLMADAVIGAFFSATNKAARTSRLEQIRGLLAGPPPQDWRERLAPFVGGLEQEGGGIRPFHWPLEFPEVFDRDTPGFDVIVGNPPFAGKNTIAQSYPPGILDWFKTIHPGTHGNADLVAHFFRRAFTLLRQGGNFGLIATNTIAQGDTRKTGLYWLRSHGGEIYAARRRYRWPGEAAVVVSIVHVHKGPYAESRALDGGEVEKITAFLTDRGDDEEPAPLAANKGKSFIGSYVLGMGFTFDDHNLDKGSTPLAEMERLIAENPRNAERIFPYIGGAEVNDSPTHAHHRYVINFEDFPLKREDLGKFWAAAAPEERRAWLRQGVVPLDYPCPVAADWPELLAIVEAKVRSERKALKDNSDGRRRKKLWWLWGRYTPSLYQSISGLECVLVISRVSQYFAASFLPSGMVYSEQLVVFALPTHAAFAALQARPHEIWARFFASSLEDRLRYTPSDCFETFPFPPGFETDPELEEVGRRYYEFRAELMRGLGEGMTKIYNRFHDPSERSNAIAELRRLHEEMDRAVLEAYGWSDLAERAEPVFLGEDEPEHAYQGRLHWPHEFRSELLGRLLELNAERKREEEAPQEAFAGSALFG
ncbi:MAG TPA: hypothetical protein ENJ38_12285 [Rhodospirillales bacterium]|nr:hypothetical protein [Rhodospirillales bacterium]